MPKLERASRGNIFFDDFNSPNTGERWVVSPSLPNRYSLTERLGWLRIKHAESSTYIITDIPASDTFMFDMKNDYKPVVSNDTGGLVIYKTITDRVELVEYYDPVLDVSRNYLYLRICRNEDMYDCYGSQDGKLWELIGSARIEDAAKVGVVLNGVTNALTKTLDVDYLAMYSDRYLFVENLQVGMTVKFYDSVNNLVQSQTVEAGHSMVKFDMFQLPLPFSGYLELYSPSGTLLYKTSSDKIDPGDEFQYIMDFGVKFQIRVFTMGYDAEGKPALIPQFVSDTDLSMEDITFIGNMNGGFIEGIVTVSNHDPEDIIDLQATIERYPNDYSSSVVQLAMDKYGEPGNYQDTVVLSVPASSSNFFWMKISNSTAPTLSKYDTFKFKIVFKNA